ncbi:MAG: hypothetical protein PHV11_05870 [Candidatus Bipolaricaulis sp.]|jgi:hypothetical protein|nr:hypothetical protein [Candidatus Bipolaricaulis sp.]
MATKNTTGLKEINIPYLEGLNSSVSSSISRKNELVYTENTRFDKIGEISKRQGTRRLGNVITSVGNYGLFFFSNTTATNTGFFRISKVGSTTSVYYLHTSGTFTALTGGGTSLTATNHSFTSAESCLFFVNGTDSNRYISSDGSTVVTASTATGHLYGSPIAKKIAYYKDRLYVGNYLIGTTKYPTSVMFSSKPLGIVALVDGDFSTGATSINVTESKYILSSDILQVYRSGSLITTLTVTAKTETSITVNATGADIKSSDELWTDNSYSGSRIFRWSSNPQSGDINAKKYDTFKLSGSGSSELTILDTINDVLVIGNKENMATWNESSLRGFDMGISCVSERGYAKGFGLLFFVGYGGLYAFDGSSTPQLLSNKVKPFFTGATKAAIEGSAVGIKGNSVLVSLAATTLYNDDGSVLKSLTNIVLEFNIEQKNWSMHTGLSINDFETYRASDNVDRLEFSGTTGEVYELFRDTSDDSVTTNKEIPFNITTSPITLSSEFENYCYPKEIVVKVESGNGINCFLDLDESGEFFPIQGDIRKGVNVIKIVPRSSTDSEVRCRTLSLSLREMSTRPVKISKFKIIYSESLERNIPHD